MNPRRAIVIGALSGLAFSCAALGQGKITAQAVHVEFEELNVSYNFAGETVYVYEYNLNQNSPDLNHLFDSYFMVVSVGSNASDNQIQQAKKKAFDENRCNFWHGGSLSRVIHGGGQNQVVIDPIVPAVLPRTGFSIEHETGGGGAIDLATSPVNIYLQSVVQHAKRSAGRAWTVKNSFKVDSISDFRIEVVYDDGSDISETETLITSLYEEAWLESGDLYFPDGSTDAASAHISLLMGNPAAQALLRNGRMIDIMRGIESLDDHPGNDNHLGERIHIPGLDFTIAAGGTYTFHISGKIRGQEFGSFQEVHVTIGTVHIGHGCD